VLYNTPCAITTARKTNLAIQEFNDYIKFYPNTDLAGNAYFYLAEYQFKAATTRKQSRTTISFCRIFPAEIRLPLRQLKKGYALLELGKEDEGTQELKRVIQRYPRTNERFRPVKDCEK